MAKKKFFLRTSFKNSGEMDDYLETEDLGIVFEKYGKLVMPKIRKINLDLPEWLIAQLDLEAKRAGVSRQPLIKLWLTQKLDYERKKRSTILKI
ncbi:MAG: CopG family transcriptional regulator [Deltaproteobacteria bacterium]|nr:CopG family transcriptional regulator [Deltaproteobacteria bacterium]